MKRTACEPPLAFHTQLFSFSRISGSLEQAKSTCMMSQLPVLSLKFLLFQAVQPFAPRSSAEILMSSSQSAYCYYYYYYYYDYDYYLWLLLFYQLTTDGVHVITILDACKIFYYG